MQNNDNHLYALFNAGGGGTRLWPRSRNKTPKQFLKLFGKKTLTQLTAKRYSKILPWERIIIVTTSYSYKKELLKELPALPSGNIVVEPARRNTGPAHGLGALYIYKRDKEAVIMTSPVDHLVSPDEKYLKTIQIAAKMASKGDNLVTVGITPTYPHTGYGYIKRGVKVDKIGGREIYRVAKFTEKPESKTAKKFFKGGQHFWNTSQFVWRAESILNSLKKHSPDVYRLLEKIEKVIGTKDEQKVLKTAYEQMPEIAIDYAVAEKAKNFYLVVAEYSWTDIGDWKEVWENIDKDASGNVVIDGDELGGRVINLDSTNSIIHSDGRLLVVIGVDNLAVIDTKNAVLIVSKDQAQKVKKIVNQLKKENKKEYL